MYTPLRSSSNSLFGLFGGDFGLPFPDDSLDKTLDDELLLSLCASFNSLRYSSPDDMNGIGVTRSALWKDIGDAQLVMSTQDSPSDSSANDFGVVDIFFARPGKHTSGTFNEPSARALVCVWKR